MDLNTSETPIPAQPPKFVATLVDSIDLNELNELADKEFNVLEQELSSMRIELAEIPSTESLMQLYSIQAKGRAYYERSEEIFRRYIKFLSSVTLLNQKAEFSLKQQFQKANVWMRTNQPADLKNTKSGDERNALINSIIPEELHSEKLKWEILESKIKTNFTIIKSYRDQFKSINDNVLIQLSIFKNLIMLGELKVDPEVVKAMRIIDVAYTPTQKDREERRDFQSVPELNIDEGTVSL